VFTSAFDAETAVVARGDSRYDVRLSTAWDIGDNANGGYAMLPVLRSLREESGHSDPLSVTTHFLRPIQGGGDARINTSLVRRGRSVSVLTGDLTVAETQRLTVSAVFGDLDDHEPGTGIDISAPLIPEPEECLNRAELLQGVALPIASRIDVRVHPNSAVVNESKPAISEGWVRLSDGAPPTALSLPLFADAFPPSLFAKLGSVGWVPTIELTVHVRRKPADGWIQARFECDDLIGGRLIESGTLWDSTGRVVARSRQLGLLLDA
jgi:acyl-CoA thioesterase